MPSKHSIRLKIIKLVRSVGGECVPTQLGCGLFVCLQGKFVYVNVKESLRELNEWQTQVGDYIRDEKHTTKTMQAIEELQLGESIKKAGGVAILTISEEAFEKALKKLNLLPENYEKS